MLMFSVDSYLAVRRAAGFQLQNQGRLLHSFARFAAQRDESYVRSATAIDWATLAPSAAQRDRRLKQVIRFARHIRAEDNRHEIPPDGVFGHHRTRRVPYIFSRQDIVRLVAAASRLTPIGSIRPHTYSTLFGLLAATGLRISEALALRLDDVTVDGLVIRKTKFRKSRLVPLHPTAAAAMDRYLAHRRRTASTVNHVFVSLRRHPLSYSSACKTFHGLVQKVDLHPGPDQPSPRIHSLRHTFAVRALEDCPDGRDHVARHMLALSTYLGHATVADTYWYLQATPHLMTYIAHACEALFCGETR